MQFEHFALNVPDARAMAAWYCEHCGMHATRASDEPPFAHFLADRTGRVILEIYTNTTAPVPDYAGMHTLRFHWAFEVEDAPAAQDRLMEAGATVVEDIQVEDGSRIFMLRDPWGVPLQICQRATPLT